MIGDDRTLALKRRPAKLVGPLNAPYYLAYFQRAHQRGYAPLSWHWPAFFLGFFCPLYRKQHQWACIAFFFPYLAAVLSGAPARQPCWHELAAASPPRRR